MRIAISDANVAIDLFKIGVLKTFLSASIFDVHITDLVLDELNNPGIREQIKSALVTIHSFSAKELFEITRLVEDCRISIQDGSCIYYATHINKAIILSGDKRLKKQAKKLYDLEVRGTIYVIEELLKHNVITIDECLNYLTKLKETNSRMPTAEIDKRIDELLKNRKI